MIAFDASSEGYRASGTTCSFTHVTTGQNRVLFVGIYSFPGGDSVTSVTYNGVAMTQLGKLVADGSGYIYLYGLIAPASGSNTVLITCNTTTQIFGTSVSYTGVAQTGLPDATSTASSSNGTGTDIGTSVTTVLDNCWAVMMVRSPGTALSNGSGFSYERKVHTVSADSGSIFDSNDGKSPVGTFTLNFQRDTGSGFTYRVMASFAPQGFPTVTTSAVGNIDITTATGNGNAIDDGGATITERGFCWNTVTLPTVSNSKVVVAGTTGSFTGNITGLLANTHYYVRAYATNSNGTSYGEEVEFDTLNIAHDQIIKDISAIDGDEYIVSINVGGTTGSITVQLGTTGNSAVFTAVGGVQTFQGIYSGASGLIITASADFDGTIDDVMYAQILGEGTIDWTSDAFTQVTAISSEVFFKRIEDEAFNSYRFYRYLELLFKDFDGYVTVTVKEEKGGAVTTKEKVFTVGNTSTPASSFSKRRISFLCKDQAIIIGLSNASLNETFAIAKFLLSGHKRPRKMFGADTIISVGSN